MLGPDPQNRAKVLCSLYLDDLAAAIRDEIDPDFGMVVALESKVGNGALYKIIALLFLVTMQSALIRRAVSVKTASS